jgi:hypothetical protein
MAIPTRAAAERAAVRQGVEQRREHFATDDHQLLATWLCHALLPILPSNNLGHHGKSLLACRHGPRAPRNRSLRYSFV